MNDKIKKYINKGQELYKFQIYVGRRKDTGSPIYIRKQGFKTYEDANHSFTKIKHAIDSGNYEFKPREKHYKVIDLANRWYKYYRTTVKESTYASTLRIFNKHILPAIGNVYLDKLTIDRCEQAVMMWQEQSPRTFKRYIRYTNNVLDYAVNLELINSNPMRKIIRPKTVATKKRFIDFYSRKELNDFLEGCKKTEPFKVYVFFHLLAYTGIRKGEALALTWNDINLLNATLTVNKTLTMGLNNRLMVNSPKSINGNRTIDLLPETVAILREWKKQQLEDLFKLGFNILGQEKKQPLFTDANNKYLYPSKPTEWNNRICKKNHLRHIKTHGFRHTHASLLFEAGVSMEEVKERLGHAKISTTMDIYTHVTKNRKKETVTKFARFMEG